MKPTLFTNRFVMNLAIIGTASGLGNLWRFPYVVAENGGGAFLFIYILLMFFVGIPLLISELMLGKSLKMSVVMSFQEFQKKIDSKNVKFPRLMRGVFQLGKFLPVIMCSLALAYISVICGWVLYYLFHFILDLVGVANLNSQEMLGQLLSDGWLQIGLTLIHMCGVILIVGNDVEAGTEKLIGYIMPFFGLLLCILVWKSLSLNTTEEAMRFLFYPNFSRLNLSSISYALGHVLFTLSIGFTSMVTFGKHLTKNTKSPNTGFTIGTIDSFASILAGMLIFPLIVSFVPIDSNPMLLFQTVPRFFLELNGGSFFGFCFFLFLYMGALGASISLLDTLVVNAEEYKSHKRSRVSFLFGMLCLVVALFPALSSNFLNSFQVREKGLLEWWDFLLINVALPLTALMASQLVIYFLPESFQKEEFNESQSLEHRTVYRYWRFALRVVFPLLTAVSLVTSVFYFFSL